MGATVILYHVIDSEGEWFGGRDDLNPAGALMPRQKQLLVEFVKQNCADLLGKVEVQQIVDLGVPYKKIVERAEKEGADIIVISTHGRTGLDQLNGRERGPKGRGAGALSSSFNPAQQSTTRGKGRVMGLAGRTPADIVARSSPKRDPLAVELDLENLK